MGSGSVAGAGDGAGEEVLPVHADEVERVGEQGEGAPLRPGDPAAFQFTEGTHAEAGPAGQLLLRQSPGQTTGPQRGGEPCPGAPRIMIRNWRHVEEGLIGAVAKKPGVGTTTIIYTSGLGGRLGGLPASAGTSTVKSSAGDRWAMTGLAAAPHLDGQLLGG